MNIICKLGFHSWNGCKCRKCSITRDEQHNWKKNCEKCSICNKSRENVHQRKGCSCINCHTTFHTVKDCICSKCLKEFHEFDLYNFEFGFGSPSLVKNINACFCKKCRQTIHLLNYNSHKCDRCGQTFHQYIKVGETWSTRDTDWDVQRTVSKYRCKVCGDSYVGDA